MKVVFCTPSLAGPTKPYIDALERTIPQIEAEGWEEGYAQEIGCCYISHAMSKMTRRALDAGADVLVYLDYDLSWEPEDLIKLIKVDADVVAGCYRYKKDEIEYMGFLDVDQPDYMPKVRADGCIEGHMAPSGFLKVTRAAIRLFMKAYPELLYGVPESPHVDLFNHGAIEGLWYGQDYAFSIRWRKMGEKLWICPDLNITHHNGEKSYPGNLHQYLLKKPNKEGD